MIDECDDRPTGADAWGIVVREVGRCGWYRTPDFGNDLIARAVEGVGGWRLICASPEDTIHTTRARFIDAYNVLDRRDKHQTRMLPEVKRTVERLATPSQAQRQLGPGGEVVEVVEELVDQWAR